MTRNLPSLSNPPPPQRGKEAAAEANGSSTKDLLLFSSPTMAALAGDALILDDFFLHHWFLLPLKQLWTEIIGPASSTTTTSSSTTGLLATLSSETSWLVVRAVLLSLISGWEAYHGLSHTSTGPGESVLLTGVTPALKMLGLAMIPRSTTSSPPPPQHQRDDEKERLQLGDTRSTRRKQFFYYVACRWMIPAWYQLWRTWLEHRQLSSSSSRGPTETIRFNPMINEELISSTSTPPQPHGPLLLDRSPPWVARQRQERVWAAVHRWTLQEDRVVKLLRVLAWISYWSGHTTTPDVAMMLTGWEITLAAGPSGESTENNNTTHQRSSRDLWILLAERLHHQGSPPTVHVDYAHRRWHYHQLIRTGRILFSGLWLIHPTWTTSLFSHVHWHRRSIPRPWWPTWTRWRRFGRVSDASTSASAPSAFSSTAAPSATSMPSATAPRCGLCGVGPPIPLPVRTGCCGQDYYCYTCLYRYSWQCVRRRARATCQECGQVIQSGTFVASTTSLTTTMTQHP